MKLLKDAFGPMPTIRTVVARLKLFGAIIGIWLILAAVLVISEWAAR